MVLSRGYTLDRYPFALPIRVQLLHSLVNCLSLVAKVRNQSTNEAARETHRRQHAQQRKKAALFSAGTVAAGLHQMLVALFLTLRARHVRVGFVGVATTVVSLLFFRPQSCGIGAATARGTVERCADPAGASVFDT